MVEKLKQILNKIKEERGNIILFAIIKTSDLSDKWSVIFCADWTKNYSKDEVFGFVFNLFKENLTPEEFETVARIGIYDKNDFVVKSLLGFKSGFEIKEETKVNGFTTSEGFILESNS